MGDHDSYIDAIFPIKGDAIPRDHAYCLYSALSHLIEAVHANTDVGIFSIRGAAGGNGSLLLTDRSALRFRLPAGKLPILLPLAGKSLKLDGHPLRVGVPHVEALRPAAALASPLVLIKLAHAGDKNNGGIVTPEAFLDAARRKLTDMNIRAEAGLQQTRSGQRAGQPRRKVLRVKEQTHVGYAMIVQGLTAEESIQLQENGLGGRRLMGCGLFLPAREGAR